MTDLAARINLENDQAVQQTIDRLAGQVERLNKALGSITGALGGMSTGGLDQRAAELEIKAKRLNALLAEREQSLAHIQLAEARAQQLAGGMMPPSVARRATYGMSQDELRRVVTPSSAGNLPKNDQDSASRVSSQSEANWHYPSAGGPFSAARNQRMVSDAHQELARVSEAGSARQQAHSDIAAMAAQGASVSRAQIPVTRLVVPAKHFFTGALGGASEAIDAGIEGDPTATARQAQGQLRRASRLRRQTVEAARAFGDDSADAVDATMREAQGRAGARLPELEAREKARKAMDAVNAQRGKVERFERDAQELDGRGYDQLAAGFRKKARAESGKLPGLVMQADEASGGVPLGSDEWRQMRRTLAGHRAFTGERLAAGQRQDADDQRRDSRAWAQDKVGALQGRFDKIGDLEKLRGEFKAGGFDDEADGLRREISRSAAEARKQTDALDRLSRSLLASDSARERQRGFELHDQLHGEGKGEMFRGQADRVMADHRESEMASLGKVLSKSLREIPVIGEALHKLGAGKTFAEAIDKTPFGQAGGGALTGLLGGQLSKEERENPLTSKAHELGSAGRLMAGQALKNPLTWIAGGAVAGSLWANRKAQSDVDKTSDARNEEIIYGNLGNRLGTNDRLMNDVRETRGKDQNGALSREMTALRMGTEDYTNFLSAADAPGMDTDTRRKSAMTGLRIARGYGLDAGRVGEVAHSVAQGDRTLGDGSLNRDLTRFGSLLAESIKRGVSSEETSRAFSSAIERSRISGGGVLEETQRAGLMNQLLAAQQSGNSHLLGQNGADYISRANELTSGAQGKDMAFLLRSLGNETGSGLGLGGKDASTYDQLREVSPTEAARFAQSRLTPKMQERQIRHLVGAYGDNVETLATGLRDVTGMDKGQAAEEALSISQQLRAARKQRGAGLSAQDAWDQGLIRSDHLGALAGRARAGSPDDLKETQSGNTGYQTAGRQEIRLQDARIQAERVIFESEFNRRNVETIQDFGQSKRNTQQGIVGFWNWAAHGGWRQKQDIGWGQTEDGASTLSGGKNYSGRAGEDSRVSGGREADTRPGFADGGQVRGAGTDRSDNILARLSPDEHVIRASEARKHRKLLERINAGGLPAYANGGQVGNAPLGGPEDTGRETRRLTDALIRLTDTLTRQGHGGLLPGGLSQDSAAGAPRSQNLFERFAEGLKTGVGRLFGGPGAAPAGELSVATPASGAARPRSPAGAVGTSDLSTTIGNRMASTGVEGLSASWGEKIAGYCSRFMRQATERALNVSDMSLSGTLFGSTAIESGNLWKKRNLTMTAAQTKASGGYQAGDMLFTMSGSGGAGHTGMVSADGKYVIENSTRGRGGKQMTPISQFGPVDLVGRLSLDRDGDLRGDGIPGTRATRLRPPAPSAPLGRANQPLGSASRPGQAGGVTKVLHEVKVSGNVSWNGKDDPELSEAARMRVVSQLRGTQGAAQRRAPAGSARPG